MTISPKLKKFLEDEGVEFDVLQHSQAFTAQEIAGAQHVPGKTMVKSVIVKFDGQKILNTKHLLMDEDIIELHIK